MNQPYVVSGDLVTLLTSWAAGKGFTIPETAFFIELRNQFTKIMQQIYPTFELVSETELRAGMSRLISATGLPVVSMDTVYSRADYHFELCRTVDESGRDRGLYHRPSRPSIKQQLKALQVLAGKDVVLVDDVIFSGDMLIRVIKLLRRHNILVTHICAGVGIAPGVKRLAALGGLVKCVRLYDEVIDEVCERDFYPGVPQSGRVLYGSGNIGLPYILPFGQPSGWASIPSADEVNFSRFCLTQTIKLFEEIERRSNKVVCCCNLARSVIGLPNDGTRFIDALRLL